MTIYTRYKIIIEYEGTFFCGWQKQLNAPSIQQSIEQAITMFSQETPQLYGAGRTDTGVHATGQVAHFDLLKKFDSITVQNALNFFLRTVQIVILHCEIVDNDFHARFSAKKRSYKYIIINRSAPLALEKNRAWHIKHSLNLLSMQQASSYLIGHHDFSSFRATACQAHNPFRTLESFNIIKHEYYLLFYLTAPSFLHHMVRNIIGSIKLVGENIWSPEHIQTILLSKDRKNAGPTAPACGLYLEKIMY